MSELFLNKKENKQKKFTNLSPSKFYRCVLKKSSEKGQAIVEYLLLLVVTITLVIGISTKLITPLSRFMKNYAGTYVECLLETGELPSFLNTSPNPQCTFAQMEASGRIAERASVSGGGSRGSSNRSPRNASSGQSRNQGNQGSSRSNPGPRPATGSNTGADTVSTGGSSKGDKLAAQANNSGGRGSASTRGGADGELYNTQEDRGRGVSGSIPVKGTAALTDKEKPISSIKKDASEGGDNLRKGTFTAPVNKNNDRDPNGNAQADMGFQFGLYIRYFIIGGIILALIIMVGTQLNSLRKSWGAN